MRRVMLLADVPVGLTGPDARIPAVELLFGGCRPTAAAALVEIAITDAPPARPARAPDVAYDDHVRLWFDDDRLVAFDRLGVGSVSHGGRIEAGGVGDDRSWRLVVQYALVHALGRLGHHALHAAVLAHHGRAVLALGPAGAGKSTLAYAAWRRGWTVLTDDIAWVGAADASPTGVGIAGFPKPLAVPGDVMADRPADATAMQTDARGRWLLPYDAVVAGVSFPLVGVLDVGHSPGPGRLVPAPSGPDRLATILRAHPLAPSGRSVREFFPLAGRVSRLPVLGLEHDVDPTQRATCSGALLDEALARFASDSPARSGGPQ